MAVASDRRVVVTGLAAFTPIGLDLDEIWRAVSAGQSGVRAVASMDATPLPVRIAGELPAFDAKKYFDKDQRKSLKMMARTVQMGVACAKQAYADAGATRESIDPTRFGLEIGSSLIPTELDDLAPAAATATDSGRNSVDLGIWGAEGIGQVPPLWMLKYLPNMVACHVSIMLDAQGPNNSITESDAAALLALGEAFRIVRRGQADFMLTGAADSKINPLSFVRQNIFAPLSRRNDEPAKACRPFDASRDGWVVAEGAAMIAIESLDSAQARNAAIAAEIVGFGCAYDRDCTGAGIARAIHSAMNQAGIAPADVDHINAHGISTVKGDVWEANGIHTVFGERTTVFAPKSYFGCLSAAAGAAELIISLLALRHGTLPGTLNFTTADPACPVAVTAEARPITKPYFVKLGLTEVGQVAAVVVRKWDA